MRLLFLFASVLQLHCVVVVLVAIVVVGNKLLANWATVRCCLLGVSLHYYQIKSIAAYWSVNWKICNLILGNVLLITALVVVPHCCVCICTIILLADRQL